MINCEFENGNKSSLRHAVVDCLIVQDNKIILVKRAGNLLEGGKWGLVGGFVNRGETTKEAAAREIMEETGYEVDKITLFRIVDNPNRPGEDRQNISFVYFCSALGKVGMADKESDEQKWFPLSALPPAKEVAFDHAENIKIYKRYLDNHFNLPLLG